MYSRSRTQKRKNVLYCNGGECIVTERGIRIMVYLFLADGFEEVEALCPLDLLRRAGADVKTVGVTGKYVAGAHDITVTADILPEEMVLDRDLEMIILPGGMPGTNNLDASGAVHEAVRYAAERGITIGAICAAPLIIGKLGYLSGRSAVCYPGFEKYLIGANISAKSVVVDENYITAKGMGVAGPFGLALVTALFGEECAQELFRATMMQ